MRVVLDRYCAVPAGTVIGYSPSEDREHFHVTDNGITLVTQQMLEKAYPDKYEARDSTENRGYYGHQQLKAA